MKEKFIEIKSFNRSLIGYSEGDVEELLKAEAALPSAYIDYLLTVGNQPFFFDGVDTRLTDLQSIRESAETLVDNEPGFRLSLREDDFIFLMNSGFLFVFFRKSEGDNPPVYGFARGMEKDNFQLLANSFTEFIIRSVRSDNSLFNPLKPRNYPK